MIKQKLVERGHDESYIDYITRVTEIANRLTEDVVNIIYPTFESAIIICRDNPKKIMLGRFINKFVKSESVDQGVILFKKDDSKSNSYIMVYEHIIPTNIILSKSKLYDLELEHIISSYKFNSQDSPELNPLSVVVNTEYSSKDIQKIIDERL